MKLTIRPSEGAPDPSLALTGHLEIERPITPQRQARQLLFMPLRCEKMPSLALHQLPVEVSAPLMRF